MFSRAPARKGQSGQASVEAALTLPLMVFLMLGTLQLFLMLQGRIMAEYAAFRAVRAGSVNHGSCESMTHSAILALMPSFYSFMGGSGGSPGQKLGRAFGARKDNRFVPRFDGGHDGSIVWIVRDSPVYTSVPREDLDFDIPRLSSTEIVRLEIQLVYWFPLKIPFANWVISRMVLARWGLKSYDAANPLNPADRQAGWTAESTPTLAVAIQQEMLRRGDSRQYTLPILATGGLRMMTPVQARYFLTQNCPPTPEVL